MSVQLGPSLVRAADVQNPIKNRHTKKSEQGRADLRPGESLFVNGGAGNVGSAVLQLAHARGARILATAGSLEGLARITEE